MPRTLSFWAMLSIMGAAVIGSPSVSAATIIFTDRTAFDMAVGATSTETFNSILEETYFQTTPLDIGDFTISGFGDQFYRNFIDIAPYQFPFYDIDGSTIINAVTALDTGLTFTFDTEIAAFGADFAAFQDNGPRSFISLDGVTLTPPTQDGNTIQFFGFLSDTSFTTVNFTGTPLSDGFSIDNISYGGTAPIPGPATLALLCMGLAGLGWSRRK